MALVTDLPTPPSPNGCDVYAPESRAAWRQWLEANPDRVEGVWLVFRKGKSDLEGPGYMDLVEEALCFGWIDSVVKSVDDDRLIQWFSPRRAGGVWSALTKERIGRLEAEGSMTDRGRAAIDAAKANGSWEQYDAVEALVVPDDLRNALEEAGLRLAFDSLPPSVRKAHLWTVYSAKRTDTRAKRVATLLTRIANPGF